MFCTSLGTPLGHRNLARRGLEPALEAAGLDRMTWQDLRHLAACVLIAESDGDADHVSRVLGRSSAAITQAIYAHEFEKVTRADRLRDRMEAAYGAMLGGKQSLPARP